MRFDENKSLKKRAFTGMVIMAIFMAVLLGRMAYLQIWDHQKYTTLSKRNQLRLIPIPAARGLIYDRNGVLLAKNIPVFQLSLIPDEIRDLPTFLKNLSDVVPLSESKQNRFLEQVAHRPSHQRQVLPLTLTEEEVSRFAVHQYRFPGLSLMVEMQREYPHGPAMAHLIGYVGEMNKEEMKQAAKAHSPHFAHTGKLGLEKFYNTNLQGEAGYQHMETDVMGREIRALYAHPPTAGQDLHLTIDLKLQEAAMRALGNAPGAIIAMNPKNGEILAMISTPTFDPNLFVKGIDTTTYQQLVQANDRPLFNRTIHGQYPPASTIKPTVALAGLMQDKINPKEDIFDPGWYQINDEGRLYRDWMGSGHGMTNLEKALRESCDTYFYIAAEKLGIQNLAHWYQQVGLGRATGIDLPGEQLGIVPSAAWKKKTIGEIWYPGETLITGIGQGYALATPLQMAVMTSYFANRGEAFKPHLNLSQTPEKLPSITVSNPHYWTHIVNPMRQVTQHAKGTAYRYFKGMDYDVAAKTGTAQVFGLKANEKYHHDKVAKHLRDHSLFVGFAPAKDPEIVIFVLLEHERASALIASQMFNAYFTQAKTPQQVNHALSNTHAAT